MKTNRIFNLAVLLSAAFALASCTEEFDLKWERVNKEEGVKYHEVQIIASNPYEDETETKAYIETDGAGGYVSKWNSDDQIGLFQKNSVDGLRTKVTSKKTDISLSNSDRTASFAVTLAETDGAADYKYWAVYPDGAATRSADDLNLVIPQTQTFTANMFDKASDVMISEPVERAVFSDAALEMGFARVGTVVKMTLKGLTSGETLKSVTFSTTEASKYLAGIVKYDLVNDELKSGISSGKQTLNLNAGESIVVPASGNVDVWFRAAEVTLSDNFTVIAYTIDSGMQNYSYTRTVDLAAASKTLAFRSGHLASFGVTGLSSGKVTLDYEPLIPEGYYLLHVVNTASSYDKAIANTCAGSGFLDAVDNPCTPDGNGKYNASSNPELIWRVDFDEVNNKYAFYSPDSEKYMSGDLNNSSTSAVWYYMGANSGDYDGTYSIYNGATFASAKHIGYNYNSGSQPRFKFYAAPITNYPGYFTFTPAYGTPTLTFPVTSKKVSASTTSVVFSYTDIYLSDDPVVSVTSDAGGAVSNTDIADGTLTVSLNANTTASDKSITLTVSATGATPVELTITQAGAVGDANNGDVLWAEYFSGFSADDAPETSNGSSTVYGYETVTYTCVDGSTKTVVSTGTSAGGSSPELIVNKNGGSFTASGIPTGNATGMTLSFKSNGNITVSTSPASAELGSNIGTTTAPVYGITVPGGTKTLSISFANSSGSNIRIDDIVLVAGTPVPGITVATAAATAVTSATGTTATLNGSLTLENGAVNSSVTEAGFYYKLTSAGSYTKVTCASAPTSTTTFSYDLTGLIKNSEYTYYAYAVYNSGSEVKGNATEATFTPTQTGGVAKGAQKTYSISASTSNSQSFNVLIGGSTSTGNYSHPNNKSITLDGHAWSITTSGNGSVIYCGGQQLGAGDKSGTKRDVTAVTMSTSAYTEGIETITVSSSTNGTGSLSVYVGGVQVESSKSLADNVVYTLPSVATGTIELVWSQSGAGKNITIKTIKIN